MNKIFYGANQASGSPKCADEFHYTVGDRDREVADFTFPATGSCCPTCNAVMMPGGAVSPAFHAEYQARLAAKTCLVSRGGKFLCVKPASKKALADGACLCGRHNR